MRDVEPSHTTLSGFSVSTEAYSGPLELLIDLIEKRKLLINDISLTAVTDDYMQHVAVMEQNPLRETAQFVVLASTLLLLKSRSLLPVFDLTKEEEEDVEELQARLSLYQIYRDAGATVSKIFGLRRQYSKELHTGEDPIFVTDRYTDLGQLFGAIKDVVAQLPKSAPRQKVRVKQVISLEEMMERLKTRIERQLKFRFRDFAGNTNEKTTVIIGFLAVLEMVKQGRVIVRQVQQFHDIEIEREPSKTPNYT